MENVNEHDMTKRMLDRIRTGASQSNSLNENVQLNSNPVNQPKEILDEHDMTKQMLGTIRESNAPMESTMHQEEEGVIKVENDELAEEAGKLRAEFGGVDLKLYEVYPGDKNVVMVGVLDNGIEFKFSKKEQVPYINTENLRLDETTAGMFPKLHGYYLNWLGEWAEKIGEYNQSA